MWEFTSGIPPFDDREHDFLLALSICKGERPEIIKNTPQCYMDLMKKCWDKDPLKRPNISEIKNIVENWQKNISNRNVINENISEESKNEIMEFYKADDYLKQKQTDVSTFKSHPQAYHISILIDYTKKLNDILDEMGINVIIMIFIKYKKSLKSIITFYLIYLIETLTITEDDISK